jgi:hypothetical protein
MAPPPRQITIDRDGVRFTVGEDGDFSWDEIEALQLQMDHWNGHQRSDKAVEQLSSEMLKAVLDVKRVFSGAEVEEWSDYV